LKFLRNDEKKEPILVGFPSFIMGKLLKAMSSFSSGGLLMPFLQYREMVSAGMASVCPQ
jgi:hypothetical protein